MSAEGRKVLLSIHQVQQFSQYYCSQQGTNPSILIFEESSSTFNTSIMIIQQLYITNREQMMNLNQSISINDYHYSDNLISQQKQAKIYKATHLYNKDLPPVIFKGYPEDYLLDPNKNKKLIQEMNIMWKLKAKDNIVQIYSQHLRDKMVFIITQYCQGGDLEKQIEKGVFPEDKAVAYIRQIINGYRHIYEQHIVHRLLEPSNIFITDLSLKIGDFSCAIYQKEAELARLRNQLVGQQVYQAPQVLQHYMYTEQSDIYSIGLIFLSMLRGTKIFSGQSKYDILKKMKETDANELIGNDFSVRTKHFLMLALAVEPENRMTAEDMLNYKFDMIPKLILNKFLTFNLDTLERKKSNQTDKSKQYDTNGLPIITQTFGDTSPIKPRKTLMPTIPMLGLQASTDIDPIQQSNLSNNNKSISIFIPSSKGELFSKEKKDPLFKLLQVDKGIGEYESSLLMQNERQTSLRSYGSKISKNSHGLVLKSLASRSKTNSQMSKGSKVSKISSYKSQGMKSDSFQLQKINIESKPQSVVEQRSIIHANAHNTSIIEVQVHSPLNSMRLEQRGEEVDVMANWLLSLVDFSRFLNRTCYHLEKVEDRRWDRLQKALLGQKTKILRQLYQLQHLSRTQAIKFKKSEQCKVLIEIIERYQEKNTEKGYEQSLTTLFQLLKETILSLYTSLTSSITLNPLASKALFHLTHTYELMELLSSGNLQHFYSNSRFEELLQTPGTEVKFSTLMAIHDKLKKMKLIG